MALRKNSDGIFDLRLYFKPDSKIFLFGQLFKDYDYAAYKDASALDREKIRLFVEECPRIEVKQKYATLIESHKRTEAEEREAQSIPSSSIPSSDPVEQLSSTVAKLSLESDAKYSSEDAERFLLIFRAGGQGLGDLDSTDMQKFVDWKIDYLQAFMAQKTEEFQRISREEKRLQEEGVEIAQRRNLLLMQTGEKIIAELAEKNQTTSHVVDSSSTKKVTCTH